MKTIDHSIQPDPIQPDLSIQDVAEELGMHTETIRRLLTAGHLQGYKAGRHWRVTRQALDSFKVSGGVRPVGRPKAESEGL